MRFFYILIFTLATKLNALTNLVYMNTFIKNVSYKPKVKGVHIVTRNGYERS